MFEVKSVAALGLMIIAGCFSPCFADTDDDDLRPKLMLKTSQFGGSSLSSEAAKPSVKIAAKPAMPSSSETKTSSDTTATTAAAPLKTSKKLIAQADDLRPALTPKSSSAVASSEKKEAKKPNLKVAAAPASKPAAKSGGSSDSNPAARLASFLVGSVVGTPIAAVRSAGNDWKRSDVVGEGKNPVVKVLGGALLLPFVAIGGIAQGPCYGVMNALHSDPFTKDSFSLGEELDNGEDAE